METKDKNKAKQLTLNVSDSDKVKVNEIKEELNLTDKELVSVLLELLKTTDKDVVSGLVEKVQTEKAVASIKARLAKLNAKIAEEAAKLPGGETVEAEVSVEAQ